MNKFFIVFLIVALGSEVQLELDDQLTLTLGRGLSLQEANYINVDRFTCYMDPRFYDYTILELTKWVDIIDRRDQLQRDLTIIEQVIKLVDKAKHIEGIQQNMFLQITQSLSASVQEMALAEIESEWARCDIDEVLDYMRQLSQTVNAQERAAMASRIVQHLQNMQRQILGYLNECRSNQQSYELREKIQSLQNRKRSCATNHSDIFPASTRLPPGDEESDDSRFDYIQPKTSNQDRQSVPQTNPGYQPRQQSTRLPPGRSDQPESSDPRFDTQSNHVHTGNYDGPFQSNPTYKNEGYKTREPSTRLPPGRSDQPESSDSRFDTQTRHVHTGNYDKPFQSNPNYKTDNNYKPRQPSTRLPPGRSDQDESDDQRFDTQTRHVHTGNYDRPFQSNPNYKGSDQPEYRNPQPQGQTRRVVDNRPSSHYKETDAIRHTRTNQDKTNQPFSKKQPEPLFYDDECPQGEEEDSPKNKDEEEEQNFDNDQGEPAEEQIELEPQPDSDRVNDEPEEKENENDLPEETPPKKPKRDVEIERDFGPDSGHENDLTEPEECETDEGTDSEEPPKEKEEPDEKEPKEPEEPKDAEKPKEDVPKDKEKPKEPEEPKDKPKEEPQKEKPKEEEPPKEKPKEEPPKEKPKEEEPPKEKPKEEEPPKEKPKEQEPPKEKPKEEPPKEKPKEEEPPKEKPKEEEPPKPKEEPPKEKPKEEPPKEKPKEEEPPKEKPKEEPPKEKPKEEEPPKEKPKEPEVPKEEPKEEPRRKDGDFQQDKEKPKEPKEEEEPKEEPEEEEEPPKKEEPKPIPKKVIPEIPEGDEEPEVTGEIVKAEGIGASADGRQGSQTIKTDTNKQTETEDNNKKLKPPPADDEEDIEVEVSEYVDEPDGKGKMIKKRVVKKVIKRVKKSSIKSESSTTVDKSKTSTQEDNKNDEGESELVDVEVNEEVPDGKGGKKIVKKIVKRRVKKTRKTIVKNSKNDAKTQESSSITSKTTGQSTSKETTQATGEQKKQMKYGDDASEEDIFEPVEVEESDGKGGTRKVTKMVKRRVKKTKITGGSSSSSSSSSSKTTSSSSSSSGSKGASSESSQASGSSTGKKEMKYGDDASEEDIFEPVEVEESDGKGGKRKVTKMVKRRVKKTKITGGSSSSSSSSSSKTSSSSSSSSGSSSSSSSSSSSGSKVASSESSQASGSSTGKKEMKYGDDASEEDIFEPVEVEESDGKGGKRKVTKMVKRRVKKTKITGGSSSSSSSTQKVSQQSGSSSGSSSSQTSGSSSGSSSSSSSASKGQSGQSQGSGQKEIKQGDDASEEDIFEQIEVEESDGKGGTRKVKKTVKRRVKKTKIVKGGSSTVSSSSQSTKVTQTGSSSSSSSSQSSGQAKQTSSQQSTQQQGQISQNVADKLKAAHERAQENTKKQEAASSSTKQVSGGASQSSSTQKSGSASSQKVSSSSSSSKSSSSSSQAQKVKKTDASGEEYWEEITEESFEVEIGDDGSERIISAEPKKVTTVKTKTLAALGDNQIDLGEDNYDPDVLYEKDGDYEYQDQGEDNYYPEYNDVENELEGGEDTQDLYYETDGDDTIYYEYDPERNVYHEVRVVGKSENKRSLIIQDTNEQYFDDLLDDVSDGQIKDEQKVEGQKDQETKEQPKEEEKKQEQKQEPVQPEQPKEEPKKEQPKQETKQEQSKQEDPKQEQPKQEQPKQEEPKPEQPKQEEPKPEQPKPDQPKTQGLADGIKDLLKEEKVKIDEIVIDTKSKDVKDDKEKSIKIQALKDEFNPNEPTQYEPPKHKTNTRPKTDKVLVPVSTKYVSSAFDGDASEQYEFADRELLQDSDEYGYGFWVRYTANFPKKHERQPDTYYFISRLTSNQEYKDLTYYGDRTLTVFLLQNSFVFSTYDHAEKKKVKDQAIVMNEDIDGMWYFITFSYSTSKKAAVAFVIAYGDNNKVMRSEIQCRHVPPNYFKFIVGGKHLSYEGFNGQFANIFYDIDAPAFIDTEAKAREAIKSVSNAPQQVNNLIDLEVLTTPKLFNANTASDSTILDPQESQLIIEEYSVAAWFRWNDDLKVDESNTFQIFNLRSNEKKQPNKGILGDRTLELHYTYGGGSKSTVYFNTYTIEGNKGKGAVYISKNAESPNYIWTYVYFGYDNDKMKAYGALIRPGKTDEILFDPIQHKLITKLYFTVGGDEQISPFNGKIGYVGVYMGPGAYRQGMNFGQQFMYGDGAAGVYQLVKPISYKDDALDPNLVRDCQFDAEQPLVDKILIHDDQKMRINGQSEYSFGMWTRWLSTLPKFLVQRGAVHNIARLGTQPYLIESVEGRLKRANTRPSTPKDQTLAVTLSKEAYEFYTYKAKDDIPFDKLEGWWNYIYMGYKRIGDKGTARGYVQFGVDGQIKEVSFDIFHDYILEYVEFVVGKSSAPFFNGQMAKIQCSIGPGAFISSADNLRLFTQNSLPDKAQIHSITRQTLQLLGTPVNEPAQKFQFDKFQGAQEYSISGWVKWSGAQKMGKVFHIATMAQKRLADLDGKFEETLKIRRSDIAYQYSTYACKLDDCSGVVSKDQAFGEYWDQWTFIYYGYSTVLKKAFGYVKYTFTDDKFLQEEISHFYMAVFSVILGDEQDKFIGQMKTWVINVGEGSYREGGFEVDENIKVHFGFVSGTDHVKLQQAGQEAHHAEQVIECVSSGKEVPLHVQFEQSDKLNLYGVSEYGYGFWARFQHFANKGVLYQQPQWMGMARLTTQKDYKDFEQPGDRVLLILMGKNVHHFSTYNVQPPSNNVNGNIPYALESESEWTYIYFSYKRLSQTVGHAIAFTTFGEITAGIQMDVLHNLLQNYLQLTIGHAGRYYPNFNGQITTVRFNLGPGAFIENKAGILARIKNKDPKPDILSIPKTYEVFVGKQDAQKLKIDNPLIIEQEGREYSVSLWFRWFKTPTKPNQVIYRLSSNRAENDASNIGDKALMLAHIGTALFSTYTLQDQTLSVPYECNIPRQQLEIWTFAYFAYSKKERKVQYFLRADQHENKGLEPILHAVASKYWLYVGRDGLLENYNSRVAQLTVNFGEGAFKIENFLQLPVYLMAPKLFSSEKKFAWDKPEKTVLGQAQVIKFNDEPDKPIESMQEYSIGFWCRFLQAWPERIWRLPQEMQLVRLTSNENLVVGKVAMGDRILAAHVVQDNFQFATYDLNDDAPNELRMIRYSKLEGQWNYIYLGYQRSKQIASYFVFDGNEMQQAKNQELLHKPLGDFVILHIGGEPDVPSFQGILSKFSISFGPGSFFALVEEVRKTIDNSHALDQQLTVDFIHKEKHGQQQLIGPLERVSDESGGSEVRGDTWSTVGEYSISGWLKIDEQKGSGGNDCKLLFRVANNDNEHLNDKRTPGDRMLYASVCVDSIKLSTYTISQLKDWNEAKFLEEKVELGHNKKAWIYIYMGYNEDLQEVHALLHLFDEDKPLVFKGVQHYVPHYTGIYVAKDPFTKRFQGELQKWVASYGAGAFVSVQKRGYEDTLPNYRALATNQKYMWFRKEDTVVETEAAVTQVFTTEVESVDEYSVGLWTRWLISFPTTLTERQERHNIFRLSSNKEDQDKSELGDRVLAAFLTLGNYEFSTYDVVKPSNAVDTKLPYQELEGSWTYIYAAYRNKQFYGMVLFREQQKAQHVELQVQHKALTGYAKFVLGAKEFGFRGFHGWLFDPRIFFGQGAFINESQKVVDMVLKLHRKLPTPPLDSEDFKWPVSMIDTTLPDDINDKKDKFAFAFADKQGLVEYSYGFWMQNGVLPPQEKDELRGLVRLTTNNEGSDERYIGDRTLAVFTKVDELVACTYTLKDPTFEPKSHTFKLLAYHWTYVYFGYTPGKARAYILTIKGATEQVLAVKHAIPNAFYLNVIKDQSHPLFFGKFYGLKVLFGQGSYLENPQEMIEKWPYDPKVLPAPEPKEEKVLALNSAKVDRAANKQHEQFNDE